MLASLAQRNYKIIKSRASTPNVGFTLIELLLVVAIIGLFSVPFIYSYRTTVVNQALSSSTEQLVGNIRSARIFSREAVEQKQWGVRSVGKNSYAVFSTGDSEYENRQMHFLENGIEFTEEFEIVFEIGSGAADDSQIFLLSNLNGTTARVDVLETGIVESQFLP